MKDNYVIFKSPYLRYREEEFGGIAKLKLKTFVLNKRQYQFIKSLKKVLIYDNLQEVEKKVVDNLVKDNLLLKLDLETAKKLGFKEGNI